MGTIADLLAQYGQGYADPRLSADSADSSTADVMRGYREPNLLDRLAAWLPANREHGLSALNMAKAAAASSGNWVGRTPQVGRDTLAPLGLAGVGALLARPAVAMMRPKEWPTAAAIRWGDNHVFTGPNHARILMDADLRHVPHSATPVDGFVTNTGRFISREEAASMSGMPRVVGNGMVSEALDTGLDMPKRTGQGFATTLTADTPRASLPGTIVNAAEQSSKPTAGTTPLSPRQAALEQGREEFAMPHPREERADRYSPLGSEATNYPDNPKYAADLALRHTKGDADAAMRLLRENGYADSAEAVKWWKEDGANLRPYADPARAQNYWKGLDQFNWLEQPTRALSQNAEGRFYDKNRMNSVTGVPTAPDQDDELARLLSRYAVP